MQLGRLEIRQKRLGKLASLVRKPIPCRAHGKSMRPGYLNLREAFFGSNDLGWSVGVFINGVSASLLDAATRRMPMETVRRLHFPSPPIARTFRAGIVARYCCVFQALPASALR